MIGELACHRQFLGLIIAALPGSGLQGPFHSCILQLRDIATEFDLQMRAFGEFELVQLAHQSLQDHESRLPFLRGYLLRRFVIVALDQLSGRRNANVAKDSVCLAYINLFRRKINVGVQTFDLGMR